VVINRWSAAVATAGPGGGQPGAGAFADEVAFELGQGGEELAAFAAPDMQHRLGDPTGVLSPKRPRQQSRDVGGEEGAGVLLHLLGRSRQGTLHHGPPVGADHARQEAVQAGDRTVGMVVLHELGVGRENWAALGTCTGGGSSRIRLRTQLGESAAICRATASTPSSAPSTATRLICQLRPPLRARTHPPGHA
jgi:hypothetical protein